MSEQRLKMIEEARSRFSDIYPTAFKSSLADCFTEYENMLLFWFNTNEDTHLIIAERAA
jgi:hypothetical protein